MRDVFRMQENSHILFLNIPTRTMLEIFRRITCTLATEASCFGSVGVVEGNRRFPFR